MGAHPIPASKITEVGRQVGAAEPSMFKACVQAMDSAFLAEANRSQPADMVSERAITPEVFDALF